LLGSLHTGQHASLRGEVSTRVSSLDANTRWSIRKPCDAGKNCSMKVPRESVGENMAVVFILYSIISCLVELFIKSWGEPTS
jgi:hypothetical protein